MLRLSRCIHQGAVAVIVGQVQEDRILPGGLGAAPGSPGRPEHPAGEGRALSGGEGSQQQDVLTASRLSGAAARVRMLRLPRSHGRLSPALGG